MFKWSNDDFVVLPLALVCIILVSLVARFFLCKHVDLKLFPLKLIAILVVVLEIIKQILNVIKGFNPWHLPFHYCSLFVFLFPFAQFGSKKFKEFITPVAFACSMTVFISFYLSPDAIIGSSSSHLFRDFNSFHTFFFHHLVFLYASLSVALDAYKPKKKDFKNVLIVVLVYCMCGVFLSYVFNQNYNNFLFSVIGVVERLRVSLGQIPYIILLIMVVTFGTAFVNCLYYKLYFKFNKK